ncbi:hypothetical protein FJY71_06960 [candidate division WOR-3 bacterium]|nr:hypothetical protein [candidate division WOR-3 bacterium]
MTCCMRPGAFAILLSLLVAALPQASRAGGILTASSPLGETDDWHTVGTDTSPYWTGTCTRDEVNNLHGKSDNVVKVEHIVWLGTPPAETTRCGWMKFNTTSIPDSASILAARIRYLVHFWQFSFNFRFTALNVDPVGSGARSLYEAIAGGAVCADLPMPRLWDTADLNATGVAAVQNSLGRNWVAFGLWGYDWSGVLTEKAWITGWNNSPRADSPWLDVDYTLSALAESSGPSHPSVPPVPSIVRGVLLLPPSPLTLRSSLFDRSGRAVASLCPGPNDVSSLAPGVYFARSGPSGATRVVLAR